MTLEEIYKELEYYENNLEYYENRLEEIKSLIYPKSTKYDDVIVDGGKHIDNLLKYVEIENDKQLEVTILYIKGKIRNLNKLKDREIERLTKYGEFAKVIVLLREKEFKVDWKGKKRHLTWEEIANKAYCSEKTARTYYKLATEERKRTLS